MAKRTEKDTKSYTLPPSPSHSFSSSSSSDFEFNISISPRKSSTALCHADELFYKGQLLPLHLSPRISMVRTLRLSSSSTSSSSTATNSGARNSSGSSNDSQYSSVNGDIALFPDCDSSRPSSVTEDDEFKRLHFPLFSRTGRSQFNSQIKKTSRYFSLSRFSSVFRKGPGKTRDPDTLSGSSVKRMSTTAKEAIRKYLKKVKPLYEKLSQKQRTGGEMMTETDTTPSQRDSAVSSSLLTKPERSVRETELSSKTSRRKQTGVMLSHSFSGNLRYPRPPPNLQNHTFYSSRCERPEREHHSFRLQNLPLRAHGIHWKRDEYRGSAPLALRGKIVLELVGDISIVGRDRATSIGGFRRIETGRYDKSTSKRERLVSAKLRQGDRGEGSEASQFGPSGAERS